MGLARPALCCPPTTSPFAEHFGLRPRWLFQGVYGGASGIIGMLHAARAIRGRRRRSRLRRGRLRRRRHNELLDRFNGSVRDYFAPYGFGGANGMFALHTRLYMERFGATREDFGRCVAQRATR